MQRCVSASSGVTSGSDMETRALTQCNDPDIRFDRAISMIRSRPALSTFGAADNRAAAVLGPRTSDPPRASPRTRWPDCRKPLALGHHLTKSVKVCVLLGGVPGINGQRSSGNIAGLFVKKILDGVGHVVDVGETA